MNISDVGEFGFIDAIKENTIFKPDSVVVGIGDDGAVYETTPGWQQIAVIDTMAEGSHFIIGRTAGWYETGYKAVASNLSDIAAMGGIPTHIVLSTALSPHMDIAEAQDLYRGIKDICRMYGVNILGGDTITSAQGLVITVAAFGEIEAGRAIRRSGAVPGDIVAVSHFIGNAGGGLDVLLRHQDGYEVLKKAHQLPVPQIRLGRLLVRFHAHSLNDISDGLASEANEIAKASHVDIHLNRDDIPVHDELLAWAKASEQPVWRFVFQGGEDYELIFTITPDNFAALKKEFPHVAAIGTVTEGTGKVFLQHTGKETILPPAGWTHF